MKKVNKFVALSAIITIVAICSVVTAFAETQEPITILPSGAQTAYFYLEEPSAIYADLSGFTVAADNDLYSFDSEGKKTDTKFNDCQSYNVSKLYLHNNTYPIILSNSEITVKGEADALTFDGKFTDFTVLKDKLYAIPLGTLNMINEYDLSSVIASLNGSGNENENVATTEEDENENDGEGEGNEGGNETPSAEIKVVVHADLEFNPVNIAADGVQLYATEKNRSLYNVRYFTDEADLSKSKQCLGATNEIRAINGRTDNGVIILNKTNITVYSYYNGKLIPLKTYEAADTEFIATERDNIYAVTELNAVYKLQLDSSERTYLLASAHNEPGFYNNNRGVASRKNFIAVADENNDRVQIIKSGMRTTIAVESPTAVAIDYAGNVYVAHIVQDSTWHAQISVYNGNTLGLIREFTTTFDSEILDMQFNSYNDLYVLTEKGEFYIANNVEAADCKFEIIKDVKPQSFYICKFIEDANNVRDVVYVSTQDGIYKLESNELVQDDKWEQAGVTDFCVDHNGKIFAIADNKVIAYTPNEENATTVFENWDLKGATQITVSLVELEIDLGGDESYTVKYGDLIISDTKAHAIKIIDGSDESVGVNKGIPADKPVNPEEVIEGFNELKQIEIEQTENGAIDKDVENIIFEVKDCYVYSGPIERNSSISLSDGYRVIIPHFNPESTFNLIIADAVGRNEKPIVGYIYTNLIKGENGENKPAPIKYVATPPNSYCNARLNAEIYKFPSSDLTPIETLNVGTKLELLNFVAIDAVYGYRDNYAEKSLWYRVAYTKEEITYEGFVKSYDISILDQTPDPNKVLPRENATVKSEWADLYTINKETGKIELLYILEPNFIEHKLKQGKRVEVVGTFDTSEEFTQIKCSIEGFGVLEKDIYVKTEDLKYDGVNKVVVIAIIIIIATVILGIILIVRIVHVKRNGRVKDKF